LSVPIQAAPFLPYPKIREIADSFLEKHHPSLKLPIPIEEIIEFQLKIDIVPMPGLKELLRDDGHGILGFTTSNLKEIYVDQDVWKTRPTRYRYTLAHEVGHIIMHHELYKSCHFKSIREWKKFINSVPSDQHGWFEWQAYCFGGLVLVPAEELEKRVKKHLKAMHQEIKDQHIKIKDLEPIWDFVYDSVAKDFEVSCEVIQRRVDYDKLRETYAEKWKTGKF